MRHKRKYLQGGDRKRKIRDDGVDKPCLRKSIRWPALGVLALVLSCASLVPLSRVDGLGLVRSVQTVYAAENTGADSLRDLEEPEVLETERMPALSGQSGSLSLKLYCYEEGPGAGPVRGVHLSVYRVSELSVSGGSALYTLRPAYAQSGISLEGMTAAESETAAERLWELAGGRQLKAEYSGETDAQGVVSFKELLPGMYLVGAENTGSSETTERQKGSYSLMRPFLVSVPLAQRSASGNAWLYEVNAEPKVELHYQKASQSESGRPGGGGSNSSGGRSVRVVPDKTRPEPPNIHEGPAIEQSERKPDALPFRLPKTGEVLSVFAYLLPITQQGKGKYKI